MAMLFITHDLGIVRKIADRVCVMTEGRDRRARARSPRSSTRRSTPTRNGSSRPSRRAAPTRSPTARRSLVEAGPIKVWFPIKRGFLRRTVGHVKAVDGVSRRGARGRDGRRRRRIRLRQDDARPRHPAPDLVGRADRLPRPPHRRPARQARCGRCARTCRSSSRTPTARSRRACRSPRSSRRACSVQNSGLSYAERREIVARGAQRCRARSGRHGPLPARILRRPAPAHRDRARDGARAALRRARRADLGARHVRAGPDRRAPARPAAPAQPRLPVHQPRPQGGARAREPGRRDAERPRRRGGPAERSSPRRTTDYTRALLRGGLRRSRRRRRGRGAGRDDGAMPRAFLIVLDSVGIGGAADAAAYGDAGADTLGHIAEACAAGAGDRDGPAQRARSACRISPRLGLGRAGEASTGRAAAGPAPPSGPSRAPGAYGVETSKGKDTPSGHWEIAGCPVAVRTGAISRTRSPPSRPS